MTPEQKKQALENAMISFEFPKKYFLHQMNQSSNTKFILSSKSEEGGINTHSRAMSYDECNAYLRGWYDAKMKKY